MSSQSIFDSQFHDSYLARVSAASSIPESRMRTIQVMFDPRRPETSILEMVKMCIENSNRETREEFEYKLEAMSSKLEALENENSDLKEQLDDILQERDELLAELEGE